FSFRERGSGRNSRSDREPLAMATQNDHAARVAALKARQAERQLVERELGLRLLSIGYKQLMKDAHPKLASSKTRVAWIRRAYTGCEMLLDFPTSKSARRRYRRTTGVMEMCDVCERMKQGAPKTFRRYKKASNQLRRGRMTFDGAILAHASTAAEEHFYEIG